MRVCIALCLLWLTSVTASGDAEDFKIVCYFASWSNSRNAVGKFEITDIDPTMCTHLMYAFVEITEDGDVKVLDKRNDLPENGGHGEIERFVALRESSPKTKFMVSMVGWDDSFAKYSKGDSNFMAKPSLRSNFVKNVVNFALFHKFDGFDLDWKYPLQIGGSKADVENFVLLVKELRLMFDQHGLILSAAVGMEEFLASSSYNVLEISKYLHFINLMNYEFHRWWMPTRGKFHISWFSNVGHNAALYSGTNTPQVEWSRNCNESVSYWLSQGAAPEKLMLGLAFFGRCFTVKDSSNHEPGLLANGGCEPGMYTNLRGTLAYYEVCQRLLNESWTSVWAKEEHVPYAFEDNQWVTYDNEQSITEKVKYAKAMGLGGVMIWSLDTDDFRGICGKPNPLLNAVNVAVRRNESTIELSLENEQSNANYENNSISNGATGNFAICSTVRTVLLILGIARLAELL